MKKTLRVMNDVRVKSITLENFGRPALRKGKRVYCFGGISTRKYYDASSSSPRYRNIPGVRMDKLVSLTNLAIQFYNIKERTNFGHVKVLKVILALSGLMDNRITFEASSPLGVASVFVAKISEHFENIEIRSVRIKGSHHSNIPQQRVIKTLSAKSLKDMAPYLSQCALAMYNVFTLRERKDAVHDIPSLKVVKAMKLSSYNHFTLYSHTQLRERKDAVHDIPSLKVVKAMKHDAKEGTTYLVTFEASLRDETKNVETFQTQILVPTFFPITTIDFKEIKIIKHD